MEFEIFTTRTVPTIKVTKEQDSFFLHSKYDPIKEAEKWVSGLNEINLLQNTIYVLGMGAGHHIRELSKKAETIEVFELNDHFYKWVKNSGLINDLLSKKNISYSSLNDKKSILEFSGKISENLIIYNPSLQIALTKFDSVIKEINNIAILKRTIIDQKSKLLSNFESNIKLGDPGINKLKWPKLNPMILVSAGPSLTKQITTLKNVSTSKKFIIGAVGTAYIPLMENGIVPDFFMISDPKDQIVEQFQGYNTENYTLVYLCTANHHAVSNFKGKRYIVWQDGFRNGELEAKKRKEPLIKTGGSVATCLLDLMVARGAKKIALVGQDLAFTDGKSHAENTHAERKIIPSISLLQIPDYFQKGFISSSKNLSVYLKWFERYTIGKDKVEFWNCTEGGAYIEGWIHRPLKEFIENNMHDRK